MPSGTVLEIIFKRCSPASEEASRSLSPGVSMEPGLTAFRRMRRSFKSVVHVRANERMAALVALLRLAFPRIGKGLEVRLDSLSLEGYTIHLNPAPPNPPFFFETTSPINHAP